MFVVFLPSVSESDQPPVICCVGAVVCAVEEIEKSTLFGWEGVEMSPRRSKIDFIAKCLNAFVAHCSS